MYYEEEEEEGNEKEEEEERWRRRKGEASYYNLFIDLVFSLTLLLISMAVPDVKYFLVALHSKL